MSPASSAPQARLSEPTNLPAAGAYEVGRAPVLVADEFCAVRRGCLSRPIYLPPVLTGQGGALVYVAGEFRAVGAAV